MTDRQYGCIGTRLRAIRGAFGDLNQSEFAARHGFNVDQYGTWERGVRRIPVEFSEKLADAYGLSLDWIYRGRGDGLSEAAAKSV